MKNKVLFFSRDYQSELFGELNSEKFDSIHVTLNRAEKKNLTKKGCKVVACLEDDYHMLKGMHIEFPYLKYSWGADRFIQNHSYTERIQIVKKLAEFWRGILKKYQPICIVNEPVALEISEVLMIEAKEMGIEYLALGGGMGLPNKFMWLDNPDNSALDSEKLNAINPSKQNIDDSFKYITSLRLGMKPDYIQNLKSRRSILTLKKLIKEIIRDLILKIKIRNKEIRQICYSENLELSVRNLKNYINFFSFIGNKFYDNLQKIENVEFIFYPLHYEPEAVLNYAAHDYDDQLSFVKSVIKCLSERQILIVKEHPQQPGALLDDGFKKLKKKYPNILFLNSEIDSNEVIKICSRVITLGGTTGVEALVHNKQVINFGTVFYGAYEGVVNIKTFNDLRAVLSRKEIKNSNENLPLFFSKIFSLLNEGDPWPNENLYSLKNIEALKKAIERKVDEIALSPRQ